MPKTKPNKRSIKQLEKALEDKGLTKQEYIRVQAVLMKKKGFTVNEIIEANGKSRMAIEGWITAFNKNGVASLRTEAPTPRNFKLTEAQKDELKNLVHGHKPSEYGYTEEFWSMPLMKVFVKKQFDVEYKSERSYYALLHACGFSYQKVQYIDHNKDESLPKGFKTRLKKRIKGGTFSMSW